jgi:hypothetical protein
MFSLISEFGVAVGPIREAVSLGIKRGWGVMLITHPLLVPRLK